MFNAYFDESGTGDSSSFICITGYVISVTQAIRLDEEWKEILDSYGLDSFHATDFYASRPLYDKLNDTDRKRIIERLTTAINIRARRAFCAAFEKDDYNEAIASIYPGWRNREWVICSMIIMSLIISWKNQQSIPGPVKLIFDKGARYSGWFKQGYDYVVKRKWVDLSDSIGDFLLADSRKVRPIQAADFLAWHTAKRGKNPKAEHVSTLKNLLKVPNTEYFANKENLESFMSDYKKQL